MENGKSIKTYLNMPSFLYEKCVFKLKKCTTAKRASDESVNVENMNHVK